MSAVALTPSTSSPTSAARRSLLPFLGSVVGANVALHAVIAARGHRVDLLAELLLAAIAVGIVVYLLTAGRRLGQVRHGLLTAHAITYVAVTTGFALHALGLVMSRAGDLGVASLESVLVHDQWLGATWAMSGLWGVGFLLHAAGSLLGRGFEGTTA